MVAQASGNLSTPPQSPFARAQGSSCSVEMTRSGTPRYFTKNNHDGLDFHSLRFYDRRVDGCGDGLIHRSELKQPDIPLRRTMALAGFSFLVRGLKVDS